MVKNLPAMQEKQVWSLGLKDPPREEVATPSSILVGGNPMDKRVWWTTVHRVAKSRTQLRNRARLILKLTSFLILPKICQCVSFVNEMLPLLIDDMNISTGFQNRDRRQIQEPSPPTWAVCPLIIEILIFLDFLDTTLLFFLLLCSSLLAILYRVFILYISIAIWIIQGFVLSSLHFILISRAFFLFFFIPREFRMFHTIFMWYANEDLPCLSFKQHLLSCYGLDSVLRMGKNKVLALFALKKLSCCSVAKSCLTLCDPLDCSTPGSSVLHYLPEFAQIHVRWVGGAT